MTSCVSGGKRRVHDHLTYCSTNSVNLQEECFGGQGQAPYGAISSLASFGSSVLESITPNSEVMQSNNFLIYNITIYIVYILKFGKFNKHLDGEKM